MHAAGADPGSSKRGRAVPTTDDQIQKYLERDQGAERAHARASGLRAVPARPAPARARLGPPAGRRLPPQARPRTGRDRGGRRVLRALGQRADEELQAARHRSACRLRDAVRQMPARRPLARLPAVRGAAGRRACDRLPRIVVVMGEPALETVNELEVPLAKVLESRPARSVVHAHRRRALRPRHRRRARRGGREAEFWSAFRSLGDWYDELPPAQYSASDSASSASATCSAAHVVQRTTLAPDSSAICSASVSRAPQFSQRSGSSSIERSSRFTATESRRLGSR